MIEKLKKETAEQVEINSFNTERQMEIQEVDERLSSLEGDDFLKSALSILDSALEKLEQISNENIIIAKQETADLDETITEELNKSTSLLNAVENLESAIVDIDKSELTEKVQEQISELEELHEELTGESFTLSVDSAIKKTLDASVRTDHLPSEKNGSWVTGTQGNGRFVLNDNAVIRVKEGVYVTGKMIKEKYGFDGVSYKDNDPDFSPYAVSNEIVTTVPVDKMPTDRNKSYRLAEQYCAEKFGISRKQVREYMEKNNLTWHETPDRKSIMPIPTEINAAYTHTGGISKQRSFEKLAKAVNEKSGGRSIKLCRPTGTFKVETKELHSAIAAMKKKNNSY
jgi:hypothetical protein